MLPRCRGTLARLPLQRLPRAAALARGHCDEPIQPGAPRVGVTFLPGKRGAAPAPAAGPEGENLLHLAHASGVELEGACECSLACSTCHVILEPAAYAALPPPGEEEEDLLDLAFGLTPTCVLCAGLGWAVCACPGRTVFARCSCAGLSAPLSPPPLSTTLFPATARGWAAR